MLRSLVLTFVIGLASSQALTGQEPPQVVSLSPEHLATDVDAKTTKKLIVEFDQAMEDGRSVCGGGPDFPNVKDTSWKNPKTFVIEVELEPDHKYEMSLNCPSFRNFRNTKGMELVPVPWSFTTLPSKLPDQKEQKKRNQEALEVLQKTLAERYSYYDLRVKNWDKLFAAAKPELLAAKTDAAWASAAARMLRPADDQHMYLCLGERRYGTGSSRLTVDSLYRRKLLDHYLRVKPADNEQVLYGRTDDGIGYLMIAGWSESLDLDGIDRALGELRDCMAMVVDARPNSGGDEPTAQRVAAWFVYGIRTYAKHRYRERAGKDGFGPTHERQLTGNGDANKRYEGPIAVLTSRKVMSSNESFVMMLQQARDCTVVGQPTFGSSGYPKLHDLGNGVTIMIPSWQDLRLDGSCIEGEGIAPDVLVAVDEQDLERRDLILEEALALLRKKLAK